jgi:hypothetical protein
VSRCLASGPASLAKAAAPAAAQRRSSHDRARGEVPVDLLPGHPRVERAGDLGVGVLAHVLEEGRKDPDLVKSAPHRQAVAQLDPSALDDPAGWATTWRAYQAKRR